MQIVRVKLQVITNMKLVQNDMEGWTNSESEHHSIQFERYFKLPKEIVEFKQRMMAQSN